MRKITLFVLMSFAFIALSTHSAVCQQSKDLADIGARIAEKEAENPNAMPDIIKYAHIQNLTRLYRVYIATLDKKLAVKEISKTDKAKFEGLKARVADKLAIFEEFLGQKPEPVAVVKPEPEQPVDGKKPEEPTKPPKKDPPLENGGKPVSPSAKKPAIDTKTDTYKTATELITTAANKIARQFLFDMQNPRSDGIAPFSTASASYERLLPFSIARSIESDTDKVSAIVNLKPLEFMPEAYRTDKQIGSSGSTVAATSAIDKPGFVTLLGAAIENGFVEGNVRNSILTLSTSPAAFFSTAEGDRTTGYENAGFLNKIGVSASFNINEKTPLLNNVSKGELKDFSVRFRFWGDHSARSKRFHTLYKEKIEPEVIKKLVAIGQTMEFVDKDEKLRNFRNKNVEQFAEKLQEFSASDAFKNLKDAEKETELTNLVLNFLKTTVVDEIGKGDLAMSDDLKNGLRATFAALLGVQKKEAFDEMKKHLDEFFKQPLGTVAYINNRDVLGNYSTMKLILSFNDTILKPLSFNLNAGFSWYHTPNVAMQQRRVRDFDFAMSFEGKRSVSYLKDADLSPITYSFTGRYQRLLENQKLANRKADLLKAQFLITFPLFNGLSLPVSATYSNATELEKKQGFRFNFGIKFDADKFLDLRRALKM